MDIPIQQSYPSKCKTGLHNDTLKKYIIYKSLIISEINLLMHYMAICLILKMSKGHNGENRIQLICM